MKSFFVIILALCFFSCSTTRTLSVQKVHKGTRITTYKPHPKVVPRTHDIYVYESIKRADVIMKIEENKIRIKPLNLQDFKKIEKIETAYDFVEDSDGYRLADEYAFSPKISSDTLRAWDNKNKTIAFPNKNILRKKIMNSSKSYTGAISYSDNKFVLQTLSIPFKIRGTIGEIPTNVSTGFNAGIAYGHQWNLTRLHPIYDVIDSSKINMAGYDKKVRSFALSPFAGLTPVGLSAATTNNKIEKDQTVLGLSFGLAGVFTFNRLNLGFALGFDYGLNDSKDWIYQGKRWTGIVVGLDLFK